MSAQLIDGICAQIKTFYPTQYIDLCVSCVQEYLSEKEEERRNNLLKTVFKRNCITKHEWSLQREVLQLQKEFKQHLPLLYAMKDELLSMLLIPTHVCTLTTRDAIYHNNECDKLHLVSLEYVGGWENLALIITCLSLHIIVVDVVRIPFVFAEPPFVMTIRVS